MESTKIAELVIVIFVVIACMALVIANSVLFVRHRNSPCRIFWAAQCVPLIYAVYIYASAVINRESLVPVESMATLLVVVAAGIMERIMRIKGGVCEC